MEQQSREFKDQTYAQLAKIGKAIASPSMCQVNVGKDFSILKSAKY